MHLGSICSVCSDGKLLSLLYLGSNLEFHPDYKPFVPPLLQSFADKLCSTLCDNNIIAKYASAGLEEKSPAGARRGARPEEGEETDDDWSLQRAEEVIQTSIAAFLACCILAQLCLQELVPCLWHLMHILHLRSLSWLDLPARTATGSSSQTPCTRRTKAIQSARWIC